MGARGRLVAQLGKDTGVQPSSCLVQDTTEVEVVADKLDLSPYCSEAARKQARQPVYKLSAVTNHSGSLAGGHDTAQCRSVLDDK